jgi:glutamate 5-kinase
LEQESLAQAVATATANASRGRQSLDLERDHDEWQDLEIGKGLALYNSSEIDRIKGHKRYVLGRIRHLLKAASTH